MHLPIQDDPRYPRTVFTPGGGATLDLPPLDGMHEADLVIIGGGIGGCSAALHAAEGGVRVVLLEANQIGWGAAGRNGGHIAPATKHDPHEILAQYGSQRGQRLIDAAEQGPALIAELIAKHGIDCEYSVAGIVSGAHTPQAVAAMEKRVAYWQARGRPVELLDRRQAAEAIGSTLYLGAWLDRRGAKFNPLAYVRGLARAAIKAGALLHEKTRAAALEKDGARWRVTTGSGAVVHADRVFLCTNAYSDDLWPGLRRTVVPVRAYQFASAPLRDNIRKTILPGGMVLTDSRRLLSGVRLHSDGRLQFGGIGPAFGPEGEPSWRATLGRLRTIFPQLGDMEPEFWWTGFMAMNHENSWHIHRLAPGVHAMIGCNGRGVALATIYGRELARHALGAPESDFVLPPTPAKRMRLFPVARPLVTALINWYALRDGIEVRRLLKSRPQDI